MMWRADILCCKFVVILSNLYKKTQQLQIRLTQPSTSQSITCAVAVPVLNQLLSTVQATNTTKQNPLNELKASESKRRIKQKPDPADGESVNQGFVYGRQDADEDEVGCEGVSKVTSNRRRRRRTA